MPVMLSSAWCRAGRLVGGGEVFVGDGAVGDAGVDEGHGHRSVPQHGGHGFEAHAVVDRLCRQRVTELVGVDVADPGDACATTARETLNRLSTRPSLEMSRPVSSGPAHSRQVRCSSINDECSVGCGRFPSRRPVGPEPVSGLRRADVAYTRCMLGERRDMIVRDPSVCHGQAVVRGTRIMVSVILDCLAAGMSETEIIGEYPTLDIEGIRAAAAHGAELARDEYPAVASA